MKNSIMIFGTDEYADIAYSKLKDKIKIKCFISDQDASKNKCGITIESIDRIKDFYEESDVIIASSDYLQKAEILYENNVFDYYIMLDGWLYHSSKHETMMPVELSDYQHEKKNEGQRIAIVGDDMNTLFNKAIEYSKKGYGIDFLSNIPLSNVDNTEGVNYKKYIFSSMLGVAQFIKEHNYVFVDCMFASDVLTNIVFTTGIPTKHKVDLNCRLNEDLMMEDLVLDYIRNNNEQHMMGV